MQHSAFSMLTDSQVPQEPPGFYREFTPGRFLQISAQRANCSVISRKIPSEGGRIEPWLTHGEPMALTSTCRMACGPRAGARASGVTVERQLQRQRTLRSGGVPVAVLLEFGDNRITSVPSVLG